MDTQSLKIGLSAVFTTFMLTACGGGSSSPSSILEMDSPSSGGSTLTGQLLDAPVAGIGYETETESGTTNANGEFNYRAGEAVRFFIGDVNFPGVPAGDTVTPLEMAQQVSGDPEADVDHRVAVNILRLLQSLDEDNNPENGIQIPPEAVQAAAALGSSVIEFDEETTEFETRSNVLDLVRNANPGEDRTLTPGEQAVEHFRRQLGGRGSAPYTGIWTIQEADDRLSMLMLFETSPGQGVYYQVELGDPNEPNGLEFGAYRVENDQLFYTNEVDTNGEAGTNSLPTDGISFSLSGNRDQLTMSLSGEESVTLNRVESVYGQIQGAWLQDRPDNALEGTEVFAALFIFTESHYIGLMPFAPDDNVGLEYGSYTYDPQVGDLQLTITEDIGGDSLTSGLTINSATVDRNQLTLEVQADGNLDTEEFSFSRR